MVKIGISLGLMQARCEPVKKVAMQKAKMKYKLDFQACMGAWTRSHND